MSYKAPPVPSPRSIRVARVGRAFLAAGHEVQVLTVDRDGRDTWLAGLLDGAHFVRTELGPFDRRAQRSEPSAGGGDGGSRGVRGALGSALTPLLVPDSRVEFVFKALDRGLPIARPDVVISFCPNFSSVVAGDRLARRHGAPHLIDYGDPWSYRVGYELPAWRRTIDRALERRILRRAAGVVLSAEPQARAMRTHFPSMPPIAVLTNGYDPSDYGPAPERPGDALRYLGNLYSPRLGFDCLGPAMERAGPWSRLEIYGKRNWDKLPTLPDWIDEQGPVDFKTSLVLMQRAGALLVVGNRAAIQIPSKIFNYMGAGRPILALVESVDDPMVHLGLGDQLVVSVPEVEPAARALATLGERIGQSFEPPAAYSWDQIGERYRAFVEQRG